MVSVAIAGSTGLVGADILSTLLASPTITSVAAFSRRSLPSPSPTSKLQPIVSSTPSTAWPAAFATLSPAPAIYFSGLGTTRAAAGSFAAQREIDYDLNLALAKAAKDAGVRVYVLISSGGASSSSMVAYSKMKGELDDAVAALGFEKCVILRPGLICGDRAQSRPAEAVMRSIAGGLGKVSAGYLKDFWAQDGIVIARAAVNAGFMSLEGKAPAGQGPWILGGGEIIRLGKTEWKE